jgi:hypothetical protein
VNLKLGLNTSMQLQMAKSLEAEVQVLTDSFKTKVFWDYQLKLVFLPFGMSESVCSVKSVKELMVLVLILRDLGKFSCSAEFVL